MEKEPCTREKTISSILSFYTLLTQLPYIPPDKLMLPPPTGWNIDTGEEGNSIKATELRNRGKTETVIDVLRHLPYLDQGLYGDRWTLADNTLHINYARGQLYGDYLERDAAILPLPGHIIWLTEGFERAGVYLLLNTETWEIIEYTLLGESIEMDYEAYEALPVTQKWTAYSAMPANEYFELWRWRHVTLQFVLVGDGDAFRGTGEWWCKDPRLLYEESLVQAEDEGDEDEDYVPEDVPEDVSGDVSEDVSEEDEDSDMDDDSAGDSDEEMEDIQSELQSLSLDQPAPPIAPTDHNADEIHESKRGKSFLYKLAQTLTPDLYNHNQRALYLDPWSIAQRERTKQIIHIHISHGWPVPESEWRVSGRYFSSPRSQELDLSNFQRDECLAALKQWISDRKEQERAERQAADQQDKSHQRRKIRSIARKLQTWFLVPTEKGEEIDEGIIPYAVLALVELDELEPLADEVILETKIHKVLQGLVDCAPMKEREDLREICDKASQFLKNWEYVVNQSDTKEE